jgi:hypothetical protein
MSDKYDFEFITRSLGLIPLEYVTGLGEQVLVGINPNAIVSLRRDRGTLEDLFTITMRNESQHVLSESELVAFEATIRQREEAARAFQKERIRDQTIAQHEINQTEDVRALQRINIRDQILVQHEVVNELNRGIQPGMIIESPLGKRGRQ